MFCYRNNYAPFTCMGVYGFDKIEYKFGISINVGLRAHKV